MKQNDLDLTEIHPSNGGKYSPNLHKFLSSRNHRIARTYAHVYRDKDGVLWLGYLDEGFLMGARLMQVLCNGSKTPTFAFGNLGPLVEVEGFWPRYVEQGRCAIDTEHQMYFVGDDTRWAGDEEQRTCLWCGCSHQHRERWIEPVQRDRWVEGHNAKVSGERSESAGLPG